MVPRETTERLTADLGLSPKSMDAVNSLTIRAAPLVLSLSRTWGPDLRPLGAPLGGFQAGVSTTGSAAIRPSDSLRFISLERLYSRERAYLVVVGSMTRNFTISLPLNNEISMYDLTLQNGSAVEPAQYSRRRKPPRRRPDIRTIEWKRVHMS